MIDVDKEWQLLEKCENHSHTGIPAKQRFLELLKVIKKIPKPDKILDVGGTLGTARWLKVKFPKAKVTILNKSKKEISAYPFFLKGDAESFQSQEKYDLIFAGEIIEHTYNPEGLIASCLLALKRGGYLVITTPNLACLYNRVFLLFGWTPGNYSPSLRFLTGNPFFPKRGSFGTIGDHKSVFTWKGLAELLKIYGFEIKGCWGYSYGQTRRLKALGGQYLRLPSGQVRLFLNKIIPHKMREGMLFVCRTPSHINKKVIAKGILKKSLWEF